MKYYTVSKLSDRISMTPDNFLVCEGVPITREGELIYSPSETPVEKGVGNTIITRSVEEITDPETIASFEGKPVTMDHPDGFVTPENFKDLVVGFVKNVRAGKLEDGKTGIIADLFICDQKAIKAITDKVLRQVSCGYEADYVSIAPGRGRQENIIGNHVALVTAGRCGPACAILDHEVGEEQSMKDRIMGLLTKFLDEEMKDEPADMLTAVNSRLDRIESLLTAKETADQAPPEAEAKKEAEAVDGMNEGDHNPEEMATLESRLQRLEEAIAKIMGTGQEEEPKVEVEIGEDMCKDSDTIARAEILAPGIAKTADVRDRALTAFYGTKDGRSVVDSLLNGKTFDSADKDLLFVASSELQKDRIRAKLGQGTTMDSTPKGPMTPEKINEMNAVRYGNRK